MTGRDPPGWVLIAADSVLPQPWRNGGGQTRELLAWPTALDWKLRISRADIHANGPFSAFPGIERWFTVLQGAGVALAFDQGHLPATVRLGSADGPLRFDGASAPACRLLDGPTQDLNLMARAGVGLMRVAQDGRDWDENFAMRGVYAGTAGVWRAGTQSCALPANTLLWVAQAGPGAWRFDPDPVPARPDHNAAAQRPTEQAPRSGIGAWWLGYTPETRP